MVQTLTLQLKNGKIQLSELSQEQMNSLNAVLRPKKLSDYGITFSVYGVQSLDDFFGSLEQLRLDALD